MIKVVQSLLVSPTERHFEVNINGKTARFAKWVEDDFTTDYELFKDNAVLTEAESEELSEFIDNAKIIQCGCCHE